MKSSSPTDSNDRSPSRYVAALGNVADIHAWSGIPYHFYQAGRKHGFFDGALDLHVEKLRWHRLAWNLKEVLRGRRHGGFQYSRSCLDRVFGFARDATEGKEVISHYQLFPPPDLARSHRVTFSFYIDMPLTRLFDEYEVGRTIGKAIAREAVRREQDCYEQARNVVCMSSWAAQAVRDEYGIPEEKVKSILPGANVDGEVVERLASHLDDEPIVSQFTRDRPFRLGFTGKHYRRKGLPRLVAAAEILRSRSYPVEVAVIGPLPREYRTHPAVRWLGFIDKGRDMARFVEAVKDYDLGCLPSYAEGLGISTLECLRLGVPVLGTDVGGITDCVPPRAGLLLPPDAGPEAIAEAVRPLLDEPTRYEAMRREARRIRNNYTWERTVAQFKALWDRGGGDRP